MFYASFDLPGIITDILAFKTKSARDKWVSFNDDFSRRTKTAPENCTFGRLAIDAPEDIRYAESMIACCSYKEKMYGAIVYCLSEALL